MQTLQHPFYKIRHRFRQAFPTANSSTLANKSQNYQQQTRTAPQSQFNNSTEITPRINTNFIDNRNIVVNANLNKQPKLKEILKFNMNSSQTMDKSHQQDDNFHQLIQNQQTDGNSRLIQQSDSSVQQLINQKITQSTERSRPQAKTTSLLRTVSSTHEGTPDYNASNQSRWQINTNSYNQKRIRNSPFFAASENPSYILNNNVGFSQTTNPSRSKADVSNLRFVEISHKNSYHHKDDSSKLKVRDQDIGKDMISYNQNRQNQNSSPDSQQQNSLLRGSSDQRNNLERNILFLKQKQGQKSKKYQQMLLLREKRNKEIDEQLNKDNSTQLLIAKLLDSSQYVVQDIGQIQRKEQADYENQQTGNSFTLSLGATPTKYKKQLRVDEDFFRQIIQLKTNSTSKIIAQQNLKSNKRKDDQTNQIIRVKVQDQNISYDDLNDQGQNRDRSMKITQRSHFKEDGFVNKLLMLEKLERNHHMKIDPQKLIPQKKTANYLEQIKKMRSSESTERKYPHKNFTRFKVYEHHNQQQ